MDTSSLVYGTNDLIGVIEPLRQQQAPNFLLQLLCPNVDMQETTDIFLDKIDTDLRIAPFVSPAAKTKARKKIGYSTSVFRPAYIKILDQLRPSDLTKRLAGEPLGGSLTAEERAQAKIGEIIASHRVAVNRRKEVMAAELAQNMSLTISGEDYEAVTVNYGRAGSMRKILAGVSRWSESGVSPVDSFEGMLNEYAELNGTAPSDTVMTADAWKLFVGDPKLDRILDRQLGQDPAIDLGFTITTPGRPLFKGRLGSTNIWVYNDTYRDAQDAVQTLLPPMSVLITSRAAVDGWQAHGLVEDFDALSPLDIFTKTWKEKDPSALSILSQTAPLLVPKRPDAVLFATVA